MAKKDKITIDVDVDVRTVQSVRKEIKDLTSELLNVEQGSEEWNKTLIEIGNRKKELQDINNLSRAAAMDMGEALGNITGSLRGVAGGFGAVTGAITLFGGATSDIAKVQTKLTALIAVVQGLSALENGLSKKLPAVIRLVKSMAAARDVQAKSTKGASAATVANTTSTTANTAATTASTAATGSFSLALGGLKTALISTGIGAFVVLLGTLISAFMKASEESKKLKEQQEQWRKETKKSIEVLKEARDFEFKKELFNEYDNVIDKASKLASEVTNINQRTREINPTLIEWAGGANAIFSKLSQAAKDTEGNYKDLRTLIKSLSEQTNDSAKDAINTINAFLASEEKRKDSEKAAARSEEEAAKVAEEASKKRIEAYKKAGEEHTKSLLQIINNYGKLINKIDTLVIYTDDYKGKLERINNEYEKQVENQKNLQTENKIVISNLEGQLNKYKLLNLEVDEYGNLTEASLKRIEAASKEYNISQDALLKTQEAYTNELKNRETIQNNIITLNENEKKSVDELNNTYQVRIDQLKEENTKLIENITTLGTDIGNIKMPTMASVITGMFSDPLKEEANQIQAAKNDIQSKLEDLNTVIEETQKDLTNAEQSGDQDGIIKFQEQLNTQLALKEQYTEQSKELDVQEAENKEAQIQRQIAAAQALGSAISDITGDMAGYYKEQADAAMEAGDEKAAKKNLDTYKKLQTASTIVSGLQGSVTAVTESIKAYGAVAGPIVGGVLAAGILANSAMTVKKIQATKLGSKSVSGSESGTSATMNTKSFEESVTNSGYSIQAKNNYALEELRDGVSDQRVYVVESDITNMQNKVSVKEDTGTL